MKKGILTKTLATMLLLTLTLANIVLLGTEVYALNTNLETQGTNTNNANVQFDAYFKDEEGNKIHTTTTDINSQATLYLYVSVSEGYLKDTNIQLNNPNFKLISNGISYDEVEEINTASNTIKLNKIRKGEQIELAIPIQSEKAEEITVDMFSKETEITIAGLLVKDNSKTTKITKTIKINAKWYGTAEINLEQGVIKYIANAEEKSVILQAKIRTNIIDSNLPIEKTSIQTIIPTINGISPEKIYVTSDSTKATNGNDGTNFNQTNWKKQDNTIIIEVANTINNNKITWKKDCVDEYILTYIYGEKAYNSVIEQNATTALETQANITTYNLETTKITKEDKKEGILTEQVNNIVMINVETQETINKGYMYTKNNTPYTEKITIDIANENLKTETTINKNTYTTEKIEIIADTEYKQTKINQENFKQMLGEEGYINIYNQNDEKIATINKDTTKDENNNYTINYDTKTTSIKIETSESKTVGKLKIENQKEITSNNTKEEIKTYETIKTTTTGTVTQNEKEIIKTTSETQTTLVEPTTQTQTIINNNTLSTIVENENVEIRTILKSSDITCKLFNDPTIKIQLPEYVENVTFNEAVKILFTDELEIETGTYNPETKTLEIKLKGEQTIYNDVSVAEGPTLVVNANITLNKLTPSKTDEITTTIINEEETTETKAEIKYIAPVGMVTVNTISGYNGEEESTSVSGQETTGKIETNSNAKTAIAKLTIINNNNNICKNIEILGRTPFEGNKSITTGEDLGSTFKAKLTSKITAKEGIDNSQITVYYSSNENATKDLQEETNGWTLEPQNLAEIKSYLIKINEYEMETGTSISFEYSTQIPEGLRNDEKTFGTFVVYYDNLISKAENIEEKNEQTQPEENTQIPEEQPTENNKIENSMPENNIEQNTIPENTITNNTTEEVNNNLPNNTTSNNQPQEENKEENNTKTEQEETKAEIIIPSQTQATVVGIATETSPNIDMMLTANVEDGEYVQEGDIIKYTTTVTNTGTTTLDNVEIKIPIPEGTTYRYLQVGDSYSADEYILDSTMKEVTVTKSIEAGKNITIVFEVEVNQINAEILKVIAQAKTTIGDYENTSSTITNPIEEGYFNINLLTYYNSNISYKQGDTITYIGEIKNVNSTPKTNVIIRNKIPEGTTYEEIGFYYQDDANKYTAIYNEETNTGTWKIRTLEANEKVKVILKVKINEEVSEITNNMYATSSEYSIRKYSNNLTVRVLKENLEIEHYTDINQEYIDVGDIVNYYIKVKNTGTGIATNVKITDYLPEQMQFEKLVYTLGNYTSDEITSYKTNEIDITRNISSGETLFVTITAKVKELSEYAKGTITLTNKVKVEADNIEEITKEISHKIKVKDQAKEDEEKKSEISGIAWLDASRDGIRDDDEELLKNIEVTLITKEEAKVVKTTKTDKKGAYTFKDIEKGEYLIVFAYDTTKYEITKYQVKEANEGKNSDAAIQQTTFLSDGKTIEGAITDTLKIENSNLYNIDIGLLESMKFDLSLTKTITKVTKQNGEGTKTYDYTGKDKTLAKIEIPSKQTNKTTIIIEYTIKVTNEGNIPGYAKQIVDYLPSDLKFTSELNTDWYKSTDGNLYNTTLADTKINPGETKEIKLIVTKTTNEKNLGTTNNTAEIAESYNDYGIKDIDSTEGNKKAKEDDYGSADLLISLNTGTIVIYIGLITSMTAIIAVGAYLIKKKVLG